MTATTPRSARRLPSWLLYTTAVAIWSTTWYAIVHQVAHVTPEAGVALRFALAGCITLALAASRGERWRCTRGEHALLAFQGVFMYGLAYLGVYHAEKHVPSGLVAVGYSASPLLAGIGAWLLWRTPIGPRFVFGGVFERHPKLKVVCAEADAGWVPHFIYRMDHAYNRHRYWMKCPPLERLPSEYFQSNIYLTFQDDWTAFKHRDEMNPRRLMCHPARIRGRQGQGDDGRRAPFHGHVGGRKELDSSRQRGRVLQPPGMTRAARPPDLLPPGVPGGLPFEENTP